MPRAMRKLAWGPGAHVQLLPEVLHVQHLGLRLHQAPAQVVHLESTQDGQQGWGPVCAVSQHACSDRVKRAHQSSLE